MPFQVLHPSNRPSAKIGSRRASVISAENQDMTVPIVGCVRKVKETEKVVPQPKARGKGKVIGHLRNFVVVSIAE